MILQPSSVYLREYEQIFTGSNQEFGHLTPFLGFESDTAEQIFTTDKTTYFHYPNSANIVPLSASGLVECGATPGEIPFRSDKIWQKVADYKKNTWWGDSSTPQHGTWLCSWLSGNSLQGASSAIWIDRFYDPGYIDSNTALFVKSASAVYDTPSTMLLMPGVWYRYHHMGNNFNKGIVTSLSGSMSGLRVHIDDWELPITDKSSFKNTIITQGDTSKMTYPTSVNKTRIKDTSLFVETNQEVEVLFNPSFDISTDMTIAFWAKAVDWSRVKGRSLISHDYRGGWSFYYNNGFYNPTITVFSSAGVLLDCNADLKALYTLTLPGTSNAINCAIDKDLYVWVIDNGLYNGKKHLYKIDKDSNIDPFVEFSPDVNLSDIKLDHKSNVWVLDSSTNNISSFDTLGNFTGRRKGVAVKIYQPTASSLFPDESKYVFGRLYDNINTTSYSRNNVSYPFVPGLNKQFYASIWSAELHVPADGLYNFFLQADDKAIAYIGPSAYSAFVTQGGVLCGINLTEGVHPLLVRHYNNSTNGYCVLKWKKPGDVAYEELTEYIYPSGESFNKLAVDLNGQPYAFKCQDVFYDNNNTAVYAVLSGLWSYSSYTVPQLTGVDIQSIACDKSNNYWVVDYSNNWFKVVNGSVALSGHLDVEYPLSNISLTNEYNNTIEDYEDYIWFLSEQGQKIHKYNTDLALKKVKNTSIFNIAPYNRNYTNYDWNRKYNYIPIDGIPAIQTKAFFGTLKIPVCGEKTLAFPACSLNNNDWHHFAMTYEFKTGKFKYFIDTVLRDSITISPSTYMYYNYENNIFIGADAGAINSLGTELFYDKLHFTGGIDDFRIYNYPLTVSDLTHIFLLKYDYRDIAWNMPTGLQSYLEEIERFFKYKLPGKKSQYYKIKLTGLNIQDQSLRWVIEDIIKDTVKKIAPLHTELYTIVWE